MRIAWTATMITRHSKFGIAMLWLHSHDRQKIEIPQTVRAMDIDKRNKLDCI